MSKRSTSVCWGCSRCREPRMHMHSPHGGCRPTRSPVLTCTPCLHSRTGARCVGIHTDTAHSGSCVCARHAHTQMGTGKHQQSPSCSYCCMPMPARTLFCASLNCVTSCGLPSSLGFIAIYNGNRATSNMGLTGFAPTSPSDLAQGSILVGVPECSHSEGK